MQKQALKSFTPSERRRAIADAKAAGEIAWSTLDRLLLDASKTRPKMLGLVRSLAGVRLGDAAGDEILDHPLDLSAAMAMANDADHYGFYAEQVRSLPRLTREQEYGMGRRMEFARERLEQDIARTKIPEETRETVLRSGNCAALNEALTGIHKGGGPVSLPCQKIGNQVQTACSDYNRLRARFVERNLYLVIGMSAAYRTYGIPVMDLIQEGNASLIRAVEKYDWRKDVRFQTYAAFWVRQAVERLITANRGIVRVPNYIQQKMRRLRREGKLPRNQKEMDVRAVSEHFDTTAQAAARLMETDRSWYSLDTKLGGDDDSTYATMLAADEPDSGTMSAPELAALGARLGEVMAANLSPQEREIIAMRFGLGGQSPKTLDEIGEEMSVSRERIRQMQVKALGKLHKPRLLEELKDFL